MKCCIESCTNKDDRQPNYKSASSGNSANKVTFHAFPKDPKQRAAWAKAIGMENWTPANNTIICSEHFKERDIYTTKKGIRRVCKGVVPFIKDERFESATMRVCKLCLTLDQKMYQMKNSVFAKMYENITGISPRTDLRGKLPMGVCWECAARLFSAAAFRAKVIFSDALLAEHLKTNPDIKIIDIQKLHQTHQNLKSSLSIQDVYKFDSQNIDHHLPNTLIKSEVIGIPHNEEIEVELTKLVNNDTFTIKDEEKILQDIVKTENVHETEIKIIKDASTESVFVQSDTNTDYFLGNNENANNYEFDNNFDNDCFEINNEPSCSNVDETPGEDIICLDDDKQKETRKKRKVVRNTGSKKIQRKPRAPRPKKEPYVKPGMAVDETVITITKLNHEDLIKEVQARKNSYKYIGSPYKCKICYRGFPTSDKKERHMIKHSEISGPIVCTICKVRAKRKGDMRVHMKRQHTMEYSCKLCPLVTRDKGIALSHVRYHAGSKYSCPHCDQIFERQTTYLNHLRLKHMSDCVCNICGYTFVSKVGVVNHKRLQHKLFDENAEFTGPFCEACDVKFYNQEAYNKHLRVSSKHIEDENDPNRLSNDPSIKSRRLGKALMKAKRRPVIRRNTFGSEPVHVGPVVCEQCGLELENHDQYVSHFKFSHPGIKRTQFSSTVPYMCEHCGKMFLNTTTLTSHMWVHTGEKGFECDYCHKTFSLKANLANHIAHQHLHIRKNFQCKLCGKLFGFSFNLTRHMFLHSGLKPFKCDACEKAFPTSGELRAHVDHVHLKIPRPKRVRRRPRKVEMPTLEY